VCASRPPVALATSNLPGLAGVADIYIYLIVLQQVLASASGFSTADICMHVFFIIFFYFHTSQSKTKRPTFGPTFKASTLFRAAERYKLENPQLQNCILYVPPYSLSND
jgi:hypothetical protein